MLWGLWQCVCGQVTLSFLQRFINVNTPYEAHREEFNTARTTDESKRVAPFVPSCATQVDAVEAADAAKCYLR